MAKWPLINKKINLFYYILTLIKVENQKFHWVFTVEVKLEYNNRIRFENALFGENQN